MEYFLPLSVLAMIISSLSFFLIDYQHPTTSINSENDQNPSNPPDQMENSEDEFSETDEKIETPTNTVASSLKKRENTVLKLVYVSNKRQPEFSIVKQH